VIGSVHLADVGARVAFGRRGPDPSSVPGLRWARIVLSSSMRKHFMPPPEFTRAALLAFWDDDAALDAFEAEHTADALLSSGWRVRLAPLRAHGTWPGLDTDVPKERRIPYDGPAAVMTLADTRPTQIVRFLRTSLTAERATAGATGMLWATAMVRPPFFATFSLWEDSAAIAAYAFGDKAEPHPAAMARDREKPFHKQSAFIRFRPYAVAGHLEGKNPLAAGRLAET
jgi:hypothetical protein